MQDWNKICTICSWSPITKPFQGGSSCPEGATLKLCLLSGKKGGHGGRSSVIWGQKKGGEGFRLNWLAISPAKPPIPKLNDLTTALIHPSTEEQDLGLRARKTDSSRPEKQAIRTVLLAIQGPKPEAVSPMSSTGETAQKSKTGREVSRGHTPENRTYPLMRKREP